ncbi:MAG: hypothetical protein LBP77_04290 [Rickettsiales bacterium]|nr:hypothetical protein [Rickettsiales bacterium]
MPTANPTTATMLIAASTVSVSTAIIPVANSAVAIIAQANAVKLPE